MWELIQANKRKSIILFTGMGVCLVLLGYIVGSAFSPDGGITGLFIALGIWIIMSFLSYFSGDSILLSISKAKEVSHDVHPQLFNVVEEMKIASNFPVLPKVYIIDDAAPNAFATGVKPQNCAITVTAGLLSKLNRDELQGVVAHEMSHIVNRDVLFMTFAGVLLGSIVIISQVFLRSMFYSSMSSRRYRSRSSGGGQAQIIMIVIAVIFAILAPILARLLYFAISRKREYLADATACRLTRYPEGLASALDKISSTSLDLASANKVTAPMYIANPLKKKGRKLSDLTSTHPPMSQRIKILRSMMHGVDYSNYQKAFSEISGQSSIIPASVLKKAEVVPMRKASEKEQVEPGKKKGMRDVGDIMRAVNKYAFLMCACGLKIKLPPDFKKSRVSCPRCRKEIEIPTVQMAAVTIAATAMSPGGTGILPVNSEDKKKDVEQIYVRKGKGWESFSCSCGRLLQISPTFCSSHIVCKDCGRKTKIKVGRL